MGLALGSRCSLVFLSERSAFYSLKSVAGSLLRAEAYLSTLTPSSCRAWASFLLDSLISSISWSKPRVLVLYSAANALTAFNRSPFDTLESSSWTVRSPFSSIATQILEPSLCRGTSGAALVVDPRSSTSLSVSVSWMFVPFRSVVGACKSLRSCSCFGIS